MTKLEKIDDQLALLADQQAGLQQHLFAVQCFVGEPQSFKCNAIVAGLFGNTIAELRVDASRIQRRPPDPPLDSAKATR